MATIGPKRAIAQIASARLRLSRRASPFVTDTGNCDTTKDDNRAEAKAALVP